MCLYLKEGEKVRVARKNILVKKWVIPTINSNSWFPVFREETGELEFNKVLKAKCLDSEMKLVDLDGLKVNGGMIDSGFHSYRLFADPFSFYKRSGTKYYAVIPRGSEYAKGGYGDIVSTQIIVFSNLWEYLKWKLLKKMRD